MIIMTLEIVDLTVDKKHLPTSGNYKKDGYVARQVVDIKISRFITEYRAEILNGYKII